MMRTYLTLLLTVFCFHYLSAADEFAISISLKSTGTTCEKNNGKIIVTATGGIAPYNYQINGNTPQTSNVFLYLSATTHTITVTDAMMQTASASVTLTNQFSKPNPPTATTIRPSGCATQDGSITLTATGGKPPYLYSIDRTNFQPNNTWTNMDAGAFWTQVEDVNGCLSDFIFVTANINENCDIRQGGQNQSYVCDPFRSYLGLHGVNGGTPPYKYSLDGVNWQTDKDFYPVPAGVHTVMVKDAKDSLMRYMVSLYDPCGPSFRVNGTVTPSQCEKPGSILVTASQGNAPYSYSIDGINFQSSNLFTGLIPGEYTITVKDMYELTVTKFFIVGNAGCITLTTTVVNSTCSQANGSIQVHGYNGTPPYQYAIGNGNFSPANRFTDLLPNTYLVKVKDATGTIGTTQAIVNDNSGPVIQQLATTPTNCNDNTGSIIVTATNGAIPLRYSIDGINFQSSNIFTGLGAKNYTVTIKDENECTVTGITDVAINNTLTADAGQVLMICEGESIKIPAVSNGNNFSWSPATGLDNSTSISPIASPVTTTRYTLTASTGSCTATSTIEVKVNKAPVAYAGKDTLICLGKNIELNGSGGIDYSWSPSTGLDNNTVYNPEFSSHRIGQHTYTLTVKDDNGCSSLNTATVNVSVYMPQVFAGNDIVVQAGQPTQLTAMDPGNAGFITYNWSPVTGLNNTNISNPIATVSSDMIYTVTATNTAGCMATDEVKVKVFHGVDIYVPTAFTPNHDGLNDILRAIPVGIATFKNFSIYNREGQLIFRTADPSQGWDGTYKGAMQAHAHVWTAEGIDYNGNAVKRKGTVLIIR